MTAYMRGTCASAIVGALAVVLVSSAPARGQSTCVGDCNDDGMVAINELIIGVNIALGSQPISVCPSYDVNGDGMVTINELIQAVNNALNGCPPPGDTPTPTETGVVDTPTPTETVPVDTPTPTSTVPPDSTATATATPTEDIIGDHICTLEPGGGSNLALSTQALPLNLDAGGSLLIACGTIGPDGKAACDCDVQTFDPVSIPAIGDVCVYPFPGCPSGEIDCDGGNAMDVDLKGDHNIGTCDSNAGCAAACDAVCDGFGAAYTRIASGCEGYCLGGANDDAACTLDSECPGGSCVGRDPVTHAGTCNCVCSGSGLGGASSAGSLSCNVGVQINVELPNTGACEDGPFTTLIQLAPQCGAVTTTTSTGQIANANNTPGKLLPANVSTLTGTGIDCSALTSSSTAGLRLVGQLAFFDSTLGDVHSANTFQCN